MAWIKRNKRLEVQPLERRDVPAVTAALSGTTLQVAGDAGRNRIVISRDEIANQLVVTDFGLEVGRFSNLAITSIIVAPQEGSDSVRIRPNVVQPVTIVDSGGNDLLQAGGGPTLISAFDGRDKLIG